MEFDIFENNVRAYTGLTLAETARVMGLDPDEIVHFVEDNGRCDTMGDDDVYRVAVETGDEPSNYPAPGVEGDDV